MTVEIKEAAAIVDLAIATAADTAEGAADTAATAADTEVTAATAATAADTAATAADTAATAADTAATAADTAATAATVVRGVATEATAEATAAMTVSCCLVVSLLLKFEAYFDHRSLKSCFARRLCVDVRTLADGDRGGRGGRGGYGDRDGGGRGGPSRYDKDEGPGSWRDLERPELPPREDRRRDDRPPRQDRPGPRLHPTEFEPPTEEMLAKIPDKKPFTAFVSLDPRVAFDVVEDDIGYHFHDDENQTILVERVRVVCHQGTNKVKMIFVDFENQESLRNALHLDKPFRDKVVRIDVAESRAPARDGPPRREGPRRDDRDRGGLRGTQFDVDSKEAEWMAQRVQEKVSLEDGPGAPSPKVGRVHAAACLCTYSVRRFRACAGWWGCGVVTGVGYGRHAASRRQRARPRPYPYPYPYPCRWQPARPRTRSATPHRAMRRHTRPRRRPNAPRAPKSVRRSRTTGRRRRTGPRPPAATGATTPRPRSRAAGAPAAPTVAGAVEALPAVAVLVTVSENVGRLATVRLPKPRPRPPPLLPGPQRPPLLPSPRNPLRWCHCL